MRFPTTEGALVLQLTKNGRWALDSRCQSFTAWRGPVVYFADLVHSEVWLREALLVARRVAVVHRATRWALAAYRAALSLSFAFNRISIIYVYEHNSLESPGKAGACHCKRKNSGYSYSHVTLDSIGGLNLLRRTAQTIILSLQSIDLEG